MLKRILVPGLLSIIAGWFTGCNTLPAPEPTPNRPPASFLVTSALAPNNTDVVLTWTRAKDPDGDPITYTVVYKDTLVRGLTDTSYTIRNAGYETTATGTVVAYDSHRASSTTSFSQTTGQPRLRIKSVGTENYKTVYNYDSQNRLVSVMSAAGDRVKCTYDDAKKQYLTIQMYYGQGNYGTTTQWSYDYPNLTSNSSKQGIVRQIRDGKVDSTWNGITNGISYGQSAEDVYISLWLGPPPGYTSGRQHFHYTYDGSNLTRLYFNYVSNPTYITTYEYDDKINPFYQSISPTVGDIKRFSRNNVTKISMSQMPNQLLPISSLTTLSYEYNTQGLPVKCKTRTVRPDGTADPYTAEYSYTYETY